MKKKNVQYTTPTGTASWPRLNEPDTKFNKDGVYHVSLRLTQADSKEIKDMMSDMLAAHAEKVQEEKRGKIKIADLPIKDVYDDDNNPTGDVEIKFKMNAIGQNGGDRWEQRPALFDSKGKPMNENIGSGSKIRVAAEIIPYYTAAVGAGISLRLKAVQVIELVEYSKAGSFDAWKFSEEDGFVTEGAATTSSEETSDSDFDF